MIRSSSTTARFARNAGVIVLLIGILAGCDVNPPAGTGSTVPPTAVMESTATSPAAAQIIPTSEATTAPSPTVAVKTPTTTTPLVGDGSRYHAAAPPDMVTALDSLLVDEQGIYGVIVAKPDNTILYSRNADCPFIAASLYKLVLMAAVYGLRESGDLTFDEVMTLQPEHFPADGEPPDSAYQDLSLVGTAITIDEAVYNAVALSSNVAAHALIDRIGEAAIDETAADLGLSQTYFRVDDPAALADWPPPVAPDSTSDLTADATGFVVSAAADGPVTMTTPRDVARFYSLLLEGEIVNPAASAEMLAVLQDQQIDLGFPQLLPAGTAMAHKTGTLDHVVHDTGVLWAPDGPVILIAMTEATPDDDHAFQIIQRLALIAYGTYDIPPFTESAFPTDASLPDDEVDEP